MYTLKRIAPRTNRGRPLPRNSKYMSNRPSTLNLIEHKLSSGSYPSAGPVTPGTPRADSIQINDLQSALNPPAYITDRLQARRAAERIPPLLVDRRTENGGWRMGWAMEVTIAMPRVDGAVRVQGTGMIEGILRDGPLFGVCWEGSGYDIEMERLQPLIRVAISYYVAQGIVR